MGRDRFNIRVYGLLIRHGKVLVTEETREELRFIKFPGGGLEHGEGLADCLRRECKEELGKDIQINSQYYVNEFYQESAFDSKQQLISIYYMISLAEEDYTDLSSPEEDIKLRWVELKTLKPDDFLFPVDKVVVEMLRRDQTTNQSILFN